MSRNIGRWSAPRCVHNQAIWDAYERKCAAYRPEVDASYPRQPEDANGYCAPCWSALCQPGVPWPDEVWEYLNASAAAGTSRRGELPLKPARLPGAPKARREKLDKLRARTLKACTLQDPTADPRVAAVAGRPTGDGYFIAATDGSAALLERGPGTQPRATPITRAIGARWVDLPDAFHLALSRVKLLSNERSAAVLLTLTAAGVRVSAKSIDVGEAHEDVPIVGRTPGGDVEVCLSARYLDPLCGVWPLRWYVPDVADPENHAHVFEPRGASWRAAVMPMRR
jgi:hypothetical protein